MRTAEADQIKSLFIPTADGSGKHVAQNIPPLTESIFALSNL